MEDKRVISFQEGEKYAKKNNINFFEVSAKSGKGVTELFNNVINGVMEKILKKNEKEEIEDKVRLSTFLERNYKKEKNKKCCF